LLRYSAVKPAAAAIRATLASIGPLHFHSWYLFIVINSSIGSLFSVAEDWRAASNEALWLRLLWNALYSCHKACAALRAQASPANG
jgi:hypothetical protein